LVSKKQAENFIDILQQLNANQLALYVVIVDIDTCEFYSLPNKIHSRLTKLSKISMCELTHASVKKRDLVFTYA